jgi:hypothetical protein
MLAACDEPAGFAGPVQLFAPAIRLRALGGGSRLASGRTTRRLSYLMQLDMLANDSFGSIASILTPRRAWPYRR